MESPGLNEIENGTPAANGPPTRTLEKGLFVLGLFDVDHPEWTLKELREAAGLPKATTRRLVKTLEHGKWVAQDPVTGKYHLGSSALKAYYLATSDTELVRIAHPFLVQLEEETTETAILSVWSAHGFSHRHIRGVFHTGRHGWRTSFWPR